MGTRVIALDWGTSRLRAILVDGVAAVDRRESDDGISALRSGEHQAAFARVAGQWLVAEPNLPVVLVGMVGSREGWFPAPYAECPAGPEEIAARAVAVDVGPGGRRGFVVPGVLSRDSRGADVMRGEETHLLGSGVQDGLVCLPGTHCKWAEMRAGRIARFATFMTGEMYGLLREHSMIGRPAAEPADPAGFAKGLADAQACEDGSKGGSLLNLLFRARAATVTGALPPVELGPYLSGLLTEDEIAGAMRLFGTPRAVTIVADPPRSDLYVEALRRRGVSAGVVGQEATLLAGIARLLPHLREA